MIKSHIETDGIKCDTAVDMMSAIKFICTRYQEAFESKFVDVNLHRLIFIIWETNNKVNNSLSLFTSAIDQYVGMLN